MTYDLLDPVRLFDGEKIARAARLEHTAVKMHTSSRQPFGQPFEE